MGLEYAEKFDIAADASDNILGTTKNFVVSTLADVTSTLWNSLPFTPELRTDDILDAVDKDSLDFYRRSPDVVKTASFIGGVFIPGGVAVKLLGRARAGASALGYVDDGIMNIAQGTITGKRQKYLADEIANIFANGPTEGARYKSLVRQLYTSNMMKEVADNVIIEAAILTSMNAHPYMEDYLKDPLPNFALGVGIGGVLGVGLAVPSTRRAIIDLTAPIREKASFEIFQKGYQPISIRDHSLTTSADIQRHNANLQILDDLILSKESNPLLVEVAQSFRIGEDAQRTKALERAAPWVQSQPDEVKAAVLEMLSKPEFAGVDKVRFYDLNKSVKETAKKAVIEDYENVIQNLAKGHLGSKSDHERIAKSFLTEDGKPAIAFVRLSSGEMFAASGARNAALAVDIKDIKGHIKGFTTQAAQKDLYNIRKGFAEDNLFRVKSSAASDAEFLEEMVKFKNLKEEVIPGITITPDHLPRMNAYIAWLDTKPPETLTKLQVRIKSEWPNYNEATRLVNSVSAVGKDYEPMAIKAGIDTNIFDNRKAGLSESANALLNEWISGTRSQKVKVRAAFAAWMRNEGSSEFTREAREIWEAGQATRDAFKKIADADGFVYLWRGIYGKDGPRGHAAVESYSTLRGVADNFAGVKGNLHRVHVDNIIASVANAGEHEILVSSPHHQLVNNIPTNTAATTQVALSNVSKESMISAADIVKMYADETERQVHELIASKIMSTEEISARLNITKDAVLAVSIGAKLSEYPAQWRRYTSVEDIESKYLNPRNKLYAVLGNPTKQQLPDQIANLDTKTMRDFHQDMVEQNTLLSRSVIAHDALNLFSTKEMKVMLDTVYNNLAEVNNVRVGDVRYQSADQALRNLKSGSIITYLGKEIINRIDKTKRQLLEPLATLFTPFKDKPEMFVEFNAVYNRLLGLQGWRDIRIDPQTGYGYLVQRKGTGKGIEEVPVTKADGTTFYIKQKEVLDVLEGTRNVSGEMLKLHNLMRGITGQAPTNDIGFWLPPPTLVGKNVAFVIDNSGTQNTQVLLANSADELKDLIHSYTAQHSQDIKTGKINVITEGQREDYNLAKNYVDYSESNSITYVDSNAFKTGSLEQAIVPSDDRFVNALMQGYDNSIVNGFRRYTETYLNDTMAWLDKQSAYYQQGVKDQPKGQVSKESARDSARAVKNILLGRDQLESSVSLKKINTLTDVLYNRAATAVNSVAKTFGAEKTGSREFFDNLSQTLKQKGIDNPWQSFDEYLATTVAETRNIAPHIQSAGNGLLATLNLRMFEVAQAAINIMSLPILTSAALMERLPGTVIAPGVQPLKFPLEIMFNGMRHMFSEEGKRMSKLWEEAGHIDQTVRQYTEITAITKGARMNREFMDKAVDAVQGFQNNKWIKDYFSKPADWAEKATRKYAMHTGYLAAKQAYPGIDDIAATVAAVAFADRTIGNYHAAQRPALFQGTFGAAIGLYQTYILTYAQSIYRGLENKNLKQLGAQAIAQSALFGMSSWPGYHLLSEQVVGHISDQHIDLTTGTYRAVGDDAARLILYGLPSSIGPAFYTRGDVSPRIPSTMVDIALFNGIKQGWSAAANIISKTSSGLSNGQATQSMLEALSLQSMNRPIARWSELVSGSSITQQNNTMSPSAEVWTPVGIASRLIGTRPIQEQVTRNALYLNRYYESLDHDRRASVVDKIATSVRNGKLNDTLLAEVASDYLRFGGTAKGWRSALNEVLIKSEEGTRLSLLRKLEQDSPLNRMIADLY